MTGKKSNKSTNSKVAHTCIFANKKDYEKPHSIQQQKLETGVTQEHRNREKSRLVSRKGDARRDNIPPR